MNLYDVVRRILLGSLVLFITWILTKFGKARCVIWHLQKAKLPMPEHSLLTGNLHLLKKQMDTLPPDCTINTALHEFARTFPQGMGYFDLWPFTKPILFVNNPFGALQVEKHLFDKPLEIRSAFETMTGGPNLFAMPQEQWKSWRPQFAPGFRSSYMLELIPLIVDEAVVFGGQLNEMAEKGKLFQLEDLTLKLTVDVITATVLETRLHYQTTNNAFATQLRKHVEWIEFGTAMNPFKRFNPMRPLSLWYYGTRLDRFIHAELDKRFAELKGGQYNGKLGNKSIMSLTLANYLKGKGTAAAHELDPSFKKIAAAQLRLFLVGGHDTMSSALIYCYHLLATHPDALSRVRGELNTIFGSDTAQAAAMIRKLPALINQLSYTTAVIKETLRLFPPSSSLRDGKAGVRIVDEDGTVYPTEDCYVWIVHLHLHRDPKYFKEPNSFIPERWLAKPDDPFYPVKGAWRPFEFGPQNCIGQTLALTEIKVVLALTVREFDIRPAYDEWDAMHRVTRNRTVYGTRAYQTEGGGGGAHPSDRYPCRVEMRFGSQTVRG